MFNDILLEHAIIHNKKCKNNVLTTIFNRFQTYIYLYLVFSAISQSRYLFLHVATTNLMIIILTCSHSF